ncbi:MULTISPECIES: type II toxin-antitoxin system HicB family antitoxin [Oceanobacillus]|uniref:type II toxin-antitoxin system HicB family antitoxin n=1 Tax=Oceanobacillus TaxID=182709 RepID=UPI000595E6B6|nr:MULTISPECIES: type II toxin-antitoxin system HicB family antitoxin [Oceanobacillus]
MSKTFPVLIQQNEDGIYTVECPSIEGCRSSGASVDEAMENIKEHITLCLAVSGNNIEPKTILIGQVVLP